VLGERRKLLDRQPFSAQARIDIGCPKRRLGGCG